MCDFKWDRELARIYELRPEIKGTIVIHNRSTSYRSAGRTATPTFKETTNLAFGPWCIFCGA
ncbi:MAG: hypothetical protein AB1597_08050 [Chloroflexota bacterium]